MTLPVLILAAGFGTRMGALTADRPKALIEVGGRPLIDHALQAAAGAGGPIAMNAHYRAEQIKAHMQGRPVHVLHEEPEILDSGGALRNALPVLGDGAVGTLNADAVWTGANPFDTLKAAWQSAQMGALVLLVPTSRAIGRRAGGDFALSSSGRVTPDRSGMVYTGAQIMDAGVVAQWPAKAFSMWEIWTVLMREGRLFGCIHPGHWADVGHAAGIATAEDMLDKARV
ncbi:MAG: nucleotidyltransferase family protein [Pseudomonadota bacterium]